MITPYLILLIVGVVICDDALSSSEISDSYDESNESGSWPFEDVGTRIVRGKKAPDGFAPYQVSLRKKYKNEPYHFCGGSIYNDHWILTAAHCTVKYDATDIIAVVGTNSLSSGGDKYNVKQCIEHEKYDRKTLANDVAVCKIDKKFTYGDKVKTTTLAEKDPKGGDKVVLTGWGYTNYYRRTTPDQLQMLEMTVLTQDECNRNYTQISGYQKVDETQVCALAKKDEGGCLGDSGGPLVLSDGKVQVGIVSYGVPCAHNFGDVYASVAYFQDWIKNKTSSV
ncbi:unnamed protein product [Leptosia nina]|uniref:trypsin n=1 Tax=Leptosia nina TaxID=320188 RepID=A0AAV1JHT8_9NEOP